MQDKQAQRSSSRGASVEVVTMCLTWLQLQAKPVRRTVVSRCFFLKYSPLPLYSPHSIGDWGIFLLACGPPPTHTLCVAYPVCRPSEGMRCLLLALLLGGWGMGRGVVPYRCCFFVVAIFFTYFVGCVEIRALLFVFFLVDSSSFPTVFSVFFFVVLYFSFCFFSSFLVAFPCCSTGCIRLCLGG